MIHVDPLQLESPPSPLPLLGAQRKFRGQPLEQYSMGRRMLIEQFTRGSDMSTELWVWLFIFVLSLPKQDAANFLFDQAGFRTAFLAWLDQRAEGEYVDALMIVNSIIDETKASRVETLSDGKESPKKA